jgi:hypothetical protein
MRRILFVAFLLSGCGAAKSPIIDEMAGLTEATDDGDGAGDDPGYTTTSNLSAEVKLVGTLSYGGSKSTLYSSTPSYRGYRFHGEAGDQISVWVRSSSGDAVAWLTDTGFNTLAMNDDADSSTYDSHITATLSSTGTYYVVFRDYNLTSHYFTVSLDGGPAVPTSCGGSTSCPDGYSCVNHTCYAQCGGPSQTSCSDKSLNCIVDPTGSCDPASDSSCYGICGTDCRDTGCQGGHKCSKCWGKYICIADGSTC